MPTLTGNVPVVVYLFRNLGMFIVSIMAGMIASILSLAVVTSLVEADGQCRPVLIIHGILEPADRLEPLAETIRTAPDCPNGREVTIIHEDEVVTSMTTPMWEQVASFQRVMLPYFRNYTNGIHVIGTVISRGVVEITNNHNVRSLIAIAGVQLGVSGLPIAQANFLGVDLLGKATSAADVSAACYNAVGQNTISFCQYWRDEKQLDLYKKFSLYLPYINNEIDHPNSTQYKTNLCAVNKYVMVVSENDEFVAPYYSGIFASTRPNGTICEMEQQSIYDPDVLGLKTLYDRGCLIRNTTSGVGHIDIPNDPNVIKTFILPHLD